MKFVLRAADDGFALAACGPFVIVVWRGVPTRKRLEAAVALIGERFAAIGAPVGLIGIVEERSPPPGPEEMIFLEACFPVLTGAIAAMAGVLETIGDSVAVRASGEMLAGAIGRRLELKLCFDVDEACTWIVPRIVPGAEPPYARALGRAIEKVRACIVAPPATRRAAARR